VTDLLNNEQNPEECDATDGDSSNADGLIEQKYVSTAFLVWNIKNDTLMMDEHFSTAHLKDL